MADEKIRMSQVVGVFGPGAMLDLPERSVARRHLAEDACGDQPGSAHGSGRCRHVGKPLA